MMDVNEELNEPTSTKIDPEEKINEVNFREIDVNQETEKETFTKMGEKKKINEKAYTEMNTKEGINSQTSTAMHSVNEVSKETFAEMHVIEGIIEETFSEMDPAEMINEVNLKEIDVSEEIVKDFDAREDIKVKTFKKMSAERKYNEKTFTKNDATEEIEIKTFTEMEAKKAIKKTISAKIYAYEEIDEKNLAKRNSNKKTEADISTKGFAKKEMIMTSNFLRDNDIKRYLAVFDFDFTLINRGSEQAIGDMLPLHVLPTESREFFVKQGWLFYIAHIYQCLYELGTTDEDILKVVCNFPEVQDMRFLIQWLKVKLNCDIIIISDSNNLFISEWLRSNNLQDCVSNIFANPAKFDEKGMLTVKPYHPVQICANCNYYMCKGAVLEQYIKEQNMQNGCAFDRVFFVGDGLSDICPSEKLRSQDFACARYNYALHKHLMQSAKNRTKSNVLIWKNGLDLIEQICNVLIYINA